MISIEEHRNGEIMKEHSNGNFLDNFACQKTLFPSFIASASMHEEKIKKCFRKRPLCFLEMQRSIWI